MGLEYMIPNLIQLIWSHFGHGYSKSEILIYLRSPKSKLRFGNVPNQIRNKVVSGLQQFILLIYRILKKKLKNIGT